MHGTENIGVLTHCKTAKMLNHESIVKVNLLLPTVKTEAISINKHSRFGNLL